MRAAAPRSISASRWLAGFFGFAGVLGMDEYYIIDRLTRYRLDGGAILYFCRPERGHPQIWLNAELLNESTNRLFLPPSIAPNPSQRTTLQFIKQEVNDDRRGVAEADHSEPAIFGGKPIIRGRRLAVEHVLGMMGAGDSMETILEGYDWLEREDVLACLLYARRKRC